jgi:hypothetical protein
MFIFKVLYDVVFSKPFIAYLLLFPPVAREIGVAANPLTTISQQSSVCGVLPFWGNTAPTCPLIPNSLDEALTRINFSGQRDDQDKYNEIMNEIYTNCNALEQSMLWQILDSGKLNVEVAKGIEHSYGSDFVYVRYLRAIIIEKDRLYSLKAYSALLHEHIHVLSAHLFNNMLDIQLYGTPSQTTDVKKELFSLALDLDAAYYALAIKDKSRESRLDYFLSVFQKMSDARYQLQCEHYAKNKEPKANIILTLVRNQIQTYYKIYKDQPDLQDKLAEELLASLFGLLEPKIIKEIAPKSYALLEEMILKYQQITSNSFRLK